MAEENKEEIYSGFGTLNESSDLDVSRLITEEDLIDSLFFICDPEKTGSVPVSRIIDFVKCTVSVSESGQSQSELDELSTMLDPEHNDAPVDLETCREQISEWIEKIKPQSELADVQMMPCKTPKTNSQYVGDNGVASGVKRLNFEGGDFIRPSELLIADLNSKIETLENQKKKMAEENAKLRNQLESVEETAAFQSQKLEDLTRRMRSLQQIVERREQTLSENGDLKSTVSSLDEKRRELSMQLKQIQKINILLESQVVDLEQKFEKAKADVQIAEKQQDDLQTALFKQKHLWTKSEEEKEVIEARLMEKSRKVEDLQHNMDKMKKSNCELKDQKVELELQLTETQQQLATVQMKAEKFGLPNSLASSDEEVEPVIGPSAASTPKLNKGPKKSLGMELRGMLEDDKHLPSPLCEREWEDSVFLGLNERDSVNNNKLFRNSGLAWIRDLASPNDDINLISSSVTTEIMQRQEQVIRKMSDLVEAADPSDKSKLCCSPSTFKMNLKEDFDFLMNKITNLSQSKKIAEERASRLRTAYQKLKDENLRLHQLHEDSLMQMLDCSSGFQTTLDGRLLMIKDQLSEKNMVIKDLEEKVSSLKVDLNTLLNEKLQFQCTVDDLRNEKIEMEHHIKRLQKNNLEVAEKYHKSELKALELGEEVQNSAGIIAKERQHCKHLEESLGQAQQCHQVDLKEIWRVVQKEVERDQQTEQEELYRSTDCLKGQVAREIETLKSQLYKTQAAFTALKHKTKQLQAPVGKCELKITHPNQREVKDPSSPLVDALTIEFFDGYQLTRRNSRKTHTFATVDDALYGQNSLSAPVRSRDLAISCPSLASENELVTAGTQTEEVTVSSHTDLNTSNSSSTSGVLDLDVSSGSLRSLDGRSRRKIFLRGFQRFDSESQTSQSIESNTDTDVSIPRQRSPSFLAAIEGNTKTDSSAKCTSEPGLKRTNSFTTAIENHVHGQVYPRPRSSSFQAAIESGQRTPTEDQGEMDFVWTSPDTTPENPNFPDYVQWDNLSTNINNNNVKQIEQRTVSFVSSTYIPDSNRNIDCDQYMSKAPYDSRPDCSQQQNTYKTSLKHPIDQNCNLPSYQCKTPPQNVEADLLSKTTTAVSQQTEERRLSPKHARKLSTLVEEDVDTDNSSPENAEEKLKRIALESSFHDNDRVLTTFNDSHIKMSHNSPSVVPVSPARYASIMSVNLNCTSPAVSPRCSAKNVSKMVSKTGTGSSASPVNSPHLSDQLPLRSRVAYTPPSATVSNQGSKSPLLSEKSSLVAKANRGKLQTNKQKCISPNEQDESEKSKENSTATVPKVKSARKNLARLIIEHDASNKSENNLPSSKTAVVQEEEEYSMETLQISPKGKKSPLTRDLSIHEETNDGCVSFRPTSSNKAVMSPVRSDLSEVDQSKDSTSVGPADHTDQYNRLPINQTSPKPPKISSPVSLAKIREEHLAKKREQMKHLKMPELSELTEGGQNGSAPTSPQTRDNPQSSHLIGITGVGDTPMKNPAYPSLPDDVLKSLGLFNDKQSDSNDQLTDQEIEEKFARLALAFKTDKLTLEKRLEIQERSRDIAEQNIEKELQGVKDSVTSLNHMCDDGNMRSVITKLQHHLEVLEQSTVRVSSRAEVFGAVQQENRMSKAIDVMIQFVENLKLVHEKEHTELEEARKFLQDNRVYNSLQGSDLGHFDAINLSKRSLSLAGNATIKQRNKMSSSSMMAAASAANKLLEGARRRNSVSVLPKMLGGCGTPFSLSQTSSMDPKTRFQSAIASTTVKAAVTGLLRRASIDKSASQSSLNLSNQSVIQDKSANDKSVDEGGDRKTPAKGEVEKKKTEEDAFQRGFEQGVRAHLGREMSELREQQQAFCDTLEDMMDENELTPEESESDKGTVIERLWQLIPEWEKSGQKIRLTLAGFVCLMALCSIVFTLVPVGAVTVTSSVRHHQEPAS